MGDGNKNIEAAIYGHIIGDLLGQSAMHIGREALKLCPVKDIEKQNWSEATALMLATDDSFVGNSIDANKLCDNYISWITKSCFTSQGSVGKMSHTTKTALNVLMDGKLYTESGQTNLTSSVLPRMLPLGIHLADEDDIFTRYENIALVCQITHNSNICTIASFMLAEYIRYIALNNNIGQAYKLLKTESYEFLKGLYNPLSLGSFKNITDGQLIYMREDDLLSYGNVISSLEIIFWVILHNENFKDMILRAANFGGDSDIIASCVGGIAGLIYGIEAIPDTWFREVEYIYNNSYYTYQKQKAEFFAVQLDGEI